MNVGEYKQIFFNSHTRFSIESFFSEFENRIDERFLRLQDLFKQALSTKSPLGYTLPNEKMVTNDNHPDIISINMGIIENKTTVIDYKAASDYNTEKTEEMDHNAGRIANDLFCFLSSTIVDKEPPSKETIELWNLFRGGMNLLSGNPIKMDTETRIKQEYIGQKRDANSIWWYAVTLWLSNLEDDLSIILMAIKLILRVDIPKEGTTALYYTSLSTLNYIFSKKLDETLPECNNNRFNPSIMSVSTMNDPEEGHILQEYLDEKNRHSHRYWWNHVPSNKGDKLRYYCIEPYVFCKSFTDIARLDDLSMWEVYGDRAEGACCIIKVHKRDDAECLYNIAYFNRGNMKVVQLGGERKKKGNKYKFELLDSLLLIMKEMVECERGKEETAVNWRNRIMEIAYLFKYESYSHENEMRYLYSLIGQDAEKIREEVRPIGGSLSNKTLPILSVEAKVSFEYKEVILGPKVKNPDNAAAYLIHQFRMATNNTSQTRITKSAIHYR